jgi:hypothetical protein
MVKPQYTKKQGSWDHPILCGFHGILWNPCHSMWIHAEYQGESKDLVFFILKEYMYEEENGTGLPICE